MWVNFNPSHAKITVTALRNAGQDSLANEIEKLLIEDREYADAIGDFRRAAKINFAVPGEIEIDEDAAVSIADEGAFVMAWHWVETD